MACPINVQHAHGGTRVSTQVLARFGFTVAHDSPGRYQHALASYMPVRGVRGERVVVLYLSFKYTTGGVCTE